MALPVIKVDSATGSDTQASGAGPATALFGSSGNSAVGGLSVDLSADNPDLSGVATDGSAVLFFNDTNAGSRNFAKITNTNNTTKIVTLSDAVRQSQTKAWAIGGKRSAIGTTLSKKLVDNNSAAGDAQPGWTIEFQSSHAETIAATMNVRCAGSTAVGPIIIRGASGASVLPVITFSNNGTALVMNGNYVTLRAFALQNTNATKTASIAVTVPTGVVSVVSQGLKISDSTNKFWKGFSIIPIGINVRDCEIGYCASNGVEVSNGQCTFLCNFIHNNTGDGINWLSSSGNVCGARVIGNIFYANGGDGVEIASASTALSPNLFLNNIFDSNTGDGLKISSTSTQLSGFVSNLISNNVFSNNTGYGINFTGSSVTDALLYANGLALISNDHYNNTGDTAHLTSFGAAYSGEENTVNINPAFTSAAGGDFSSTALKELGCPLGGTLHVGTYSATYSYVDIGMQAHVATTMTGGLLVNPGLSGGLR